MTQASYQFGGNGNCHSVVLALILLLALIAAPICGPLCAAQVCAPAAGPRTASDHCHGGMPMQADARKTSVTGAKLCAGDELPAALAGPFSRFPETQELKAGALQTGAVADTIPALDIPPAAILRWFSHRTTLDSALVFPHVIPLRI